MVIISFYLAVMPFLNLSAVDFLHLRLRELECWWKDVVKNEKILRGLYTPFTQSQKCGGIWYHFMLLPWIALYKNVYGRYLWGKYIPILLSNVFSNYIYEGGVREICSCGTMIYIYIYIYIIFPRKHGFLWLPLWIRLNRPLRSVGI